MSAERPTEDIAPKGSKRRGYDSEDIQARGGIVLPRYFPLAALMTIFLGIAAGTAWAVATDARIKSVESATDLKVEDSIVWRHARRIGEIERTQHEAAKQNERVILVLCSLCRGLSKADCSEACKPGR